MKTVELKMELAGIGTRVVLRIDGEYVGEWWKSGESADDLTVKAVDGICSALRLRFPSGV